MEKPLIVNHTQKLSKLIYYIVPLGLVEDGSGSGVGQLQVLIVVVSMVTVGTWSTKFWE